MLLEVSATYDAPLVYKKIVNSVVKMYLYNYKLSILCR